MKWPNENTWTNLIRAAAERHGVPYPLVQAVIAVESQFRPEAYRAEPKINDASYGLMQLLLGTARNVGYLGEGAGLLDPATNIEYGTAYLASVYEQTGKSLAATASAYNGGYRPDLGFGAPADHVMQICLARDSAGKCIRTRWVQPGEFSNADYVNAVLANLDYFNQVKAVTTGAGQYLIPLLPAGTTNPKLVGLLVAGLTGLLMIRQWRAR